MMFNFNRIFLLTFFLILSYCSFSQLNEKLYKKYYKALDNNKFRRADKILDKIGVEEGDRFFYCIKSAEYLAQQNLLDSAAKYYETAIKIRKYSIGFFANMNSPESIEMVYQKAIDNYNLIIESDSMNAVHLCNRGIFKQAVGLYEESISDFNLSIDVEQHYLTYYNRAISYSRIDSVQRAIADYSSSIELNGSNGSAYLNRGFSYIEIGKYLDAEIDFKKSLEFAKSAKEQAFALNNLGYVYIQMKDYSNARKYINNSLRLFYENAYAHRNRAILEIQLGNFDSACKDLKTSKKFNFYEQYGDEVNKLISKYCPI